MNARNRHRQAEARKGWTIIAAVALGFMGLGTGAYMVDQAQGVSVGQSLSNAGL